ncbi:SGNH/GDSL hydrolase family protein [Nocardia goodfellowii]|uniref:Lysophospholipase L1-like esterase n=1 Tax=Nocardia goodfellowii TaxID=882446 RepID=A0ABS4QE13_9NOCA|nr:SGNH/GDSL hydrolase family protein [Nocardia goodfellowii]MBP2189919.1 lysophospholipase L1-like esterase [Nocardia goodfellowii]
MRTVRALVASLLVVLPIAVGTAEAKPPEPPGWSSAWTTAPHRPSKAFLPTWSEAGFSNQTLRQVVRVTEGGAATRVQLTNRYGTAPLAVAGATIARTAPDGGIRPESVLDLTMGLARSFRIPAGADVDTDPAPLALAPMESVTITLYLAEPTGPATMHAQAAATSYRAAGDHRADPSGAAFTETTHSWYYLAGVEVLNLAPRRAGVVVFGDSITDGVGSTINADNRFPDELAERSAAAGNARAVLNQGIGGNRVTVDSSWLGDSARTRFQRDVLDQPGVGTVIILEGTNDIGLSSAEPAFDPVPVSAEQLIAAHRELIRRAHAAGLRVIGATLLPFGDSPYFSAEAEAKRQALNEWIRTAGEYDAVADLDTALADPTAPHRLNPPYDSGDHLHPNDAGYRAMADAIDLSELR